MTRNSQHRPRASSHKATDSMTVRLDVPAASQQRSPNSSANAFAEDDGAWEIAVPSWTTKTVHDEDRLMHLYQNRHPFTPNYQDKELTVTATTGSHSSSMTNPNSPHSPLNDTFPESATASFNGYLDYAEEYDSDSPPLLEHRDIPMLPARHGLSERRRSRNHLSSASLNKSSSSSNFFIQGPPIDYSSSADESLDSTPTSKRRRSKKWRRRPSGAVLTPANSTLGNRKRRESSMKSQSSLQLSSPISSQSSRPLIDCCKGSTWPFCLFGASGHSPKAISRRNTLMWLLLLVVGGLSVSLTIATNSRIREQQQQTILLLQQVPPSQQQLDASSRGTLRGKMLWQELEWMESGSVKSKRTSSSAEAPEDYWLDKYLPDTWFSWERYVSGRKKAKKKKKNRAILDSKDQSLPNGWEMSRVILPPDDVSVMHEHVQRQTFDTLDRKLYRSSYMAEPSGRTSRARGKATAPHRRRIVILHESMMVSSNNFNKKHLTLYPPDFTDNTQLYGILDSSDERVKTMERRPPLEDGECVPMQEWQKTFFPSCNSMHELDMSGRPEARLHLFGTKGYWRNAWRVDAHTPQQHDTLVLKTLKIEHRFEEAHYEHDRIDAVAMERLTASPHVINIFSFCGHSVMTEYADGNRLGELADKSRRIPLARLRIARDIASGLADVHGIDGDGNATFVHLDINPANVVSIGGTLKLNDFNIGIIRKWNTTSNQPCGFPAQYPNPQWRSPEEARNEQNLTEKVDVFSMGHIFFRLICGHEPWHKLEPGGRPSKQEVNEKVQKGILPTIPDFVMNSTSPEVIAIRTAMMQCYEYVPSKRPSAREIANSLQQALDKLESESDTPKKKH